MTQAVRPDEMVTPDGRSIRRLNPALMDAVMALPNLAKLLVRLLRDPRVPMKSKVLIGFTLGYLVTPIDLIHDIPVIGQTDDALLIAFSLNRLMAASGEDLVLEHWDGSQDVLDIIKNISEFGAGLMPKKAKALLEKVGL
jgi:uncharacterized membrane protein YkvA (DUF1232 family)